MTRERTQAEVQKPVVVGRLSELAPTIVTKDTHVAVYEAPRHPLADDISRLHIKIVHTLDPWLKELNGRSTTDAAAYQRVAKGAKNKIDLVEGSADVKETLARVIDAIVVDMESLLKQFPKYTIGNIAIKTGENSTTEFNRKWHTDSDGLNTDWLHVVRTYVGPSTEYADDAYISATHSYQDGSVCVHKSNVWHRGPAQVGSVNRFAITIRLKPKSPLGLIVYNRS